MPEADLLKILGRAYITLFERAAALAHKPRWADKNPENVLYLAEWQSLLGDQWVFIHVVRNPLDTLSSIKEIKFPLTIPAGLDERIALYLQYTQNGLSFGAMHPGRYCRVVYEELVQYPKPTLESLMEWLGETFEPIQLTFNSIPHQSGLEDPKIPDSSRIHTVSINRWPKILTAEEAQIIWKKTRELWEQIDPDGRYAP